MSWAKAVSKPERRAEGYVQPKEELGQRVAEGGLDNGKNDRIRWRVIEKGK